MAYTSSWNTVVYCPRLKLLAQVPLFVLELFVYQISFPFLSGSSPSFHSLLSGNLIRKGAYYGSYNHNVYPIYHMLFQSPSYTKCASACPEGLVGFINSILVCGNVSTESYVLHGMVTVRPLTVISLLLSSPSVSLVFHRCITAVEYCHVGAAARVVALKRAGLDDDGGVCPRGPCRVWWPWKGAFWMIRGEPEACGAKRGGKHSLPAVELPSRSVAELCETAECWRNVFSCWNRSGAVTAALRSAGSAKLVQVQRFAGQVVGRLLTGDCRTRSCAVVSQL
jgi:hypothetical protein